MTIDPQFETNRERVGKENGVAVWGPVDPPEKHGTYGTHVAVDSGICLADGACLEDCLVDVLAQVDTSGHPESDTKVELIHEDQCIDCMLCADAYPVDAINVDPGRTRRI